MQPANRGAWKGSATVAKCGTASFEIRYDAGLTAKKRKELKKEILKAYPDKLFADFKITNGVKHKTNFVFFTGRCGAWKEAFDGHFNIHPKDTVDGSIKTYATNDPETTIYTIHIYNNTGTVLIQGREDDLEAFENNFETLKSKAEVNKALTGNTRQAGDVTARAAEGTRTTLPSGHEQSGNDPSNTRKPEVLLKACAQQLQRDVVELPQSATQLEEHSDIPQQTLQSETIAEGTRTTLPSGHEQSANDPSNTRKPDELLKASAQQLQRDIVELQQSPTKLEEHSAIPQLALQTEALTRKIEELQDQLTKHMCVHKNDMQKLQAQVSEHRHKNEELQEEMRSVVKQLEKLQLNEPHLSINEQRGSNDQRKDGQEETLPESSGQGDHQERSA